MSFCIVIYGGVLINYCVIIDFEKPTLIFFHERITINIRSDFAVTFF